MTKEAQLVEPVSAEPTMPAGATSVPRAYPPVLIVPSHVSSGTIFQLTAAGYIPIITDEPDKVRLVAAQTQVEAGDMIMAALHGLDQPYNDVAKVEFVKELHRRMKQREKQPPTTAYP